MATKMQWAGNHIEIDPPKRTKKLTGTRLASVLGLNRWSTPFEIWCAVTKFYEKPFEDTKYTIAGKTIEPKQAQYMKDEYMMFNLITPTDVYGEDYFHKTWGDFFPENEIFGGMWDYLLIGKDGKPNTVLEMKTSKRVEDWAEDIPEYYALQAALYAYLLGVDRVIMVASFLEEKDYENPDTYECNADNTITREFLLSERYPNFEEDYIIPAQKWWNAFVKTGISPDFDEKKDEEILKVLRTNHPNIDNDMDKILKEAEEVKDRLELGKALLKKDEDRLKQLTELIKEKAIASFRDGDDHVTITGQRYTWSVGKSSTAKLDKKLMKADGVLDRYTYYEESYRITQKKIEEEK